MTSLDLSKKQKKTILTINFGSILEWYEVYMFAYLTPVLSKVFFNFESDLSSLTLVFIFFGTGFLVRTFGAIIFGHIGDIKGRKPAFLKSITFMTIPTFAMGCIGSYESWGVFAPISLCLLRILQAIPAAGEVPGALCFLYEYSDSQNRKFMTSWTAVGNQLGSILGILETFLIDIFFSHEFLLSWGWRISFWIGGLIGLLGFCLRRKLHETAVFEKLESHHNLMKETIMSFISRFKKKILLGVGYGAVNAATYYLIATYIPTFFSNSIGLTIYWNTAISLSMLILSTLLLPIFGYLGEKFNNQKMLVYSCITIIALLIPIYISIQKSNLLLMAVSGGLYIVPITCISSLLAYRIACLFPDQVRYTGASLAFNLADGAIGGFTPAIALLLLQFTGNQGAFCAFILICALISLFSYRKVQD